MSRAPSLSAESSSLRVTRSLNDSRPSAIVEFDFGHARTFLVGKNLLHRTAPRTRSFTNQVLVVVQSAEPATSDAKPRCPHIASWFPRQTLASSDKQTNNEPKVGSKHSRGFLGVRPPGDA